MPCFNLLGIEICIPSLDDIVNAVVAPITGFVTSALSGLVSTLTPLFHSVVNTLTPLFQTVIDSITGFLTNPLGFLQTTLSSAWSVLSTLWNDITRALTGLWNQISTGLASIGSQIVGGLDALRGSITSGLSSLGSSLTTLLNDAWITLSNGIDLVGSSLSGALETAQTVLMAAFDGMGNAISGIMGGIFSGFGALDVNGIVGAASNVLGMAESALTSTLLHHSPIEPEETVETVSSFVTRVHAAAVSLHIANIVAEAASLGQVDVTLTEAWNYPNTAAAMKVATEFASMPLLEGLGPAYKRYILKNYQPNIPMYQDLIEIYVREGYLESHWVELPAEMVNNFKELGYSEYWTQRLWGKHWVYPSPTQLYEMMHRTAGDFPEIGVTSDVLRNMLKLHDFEPMWRMPLEAISWNTWRIYDIRTGWEMDLLNDDALVNRLIDTGYEPKDAELLANIQKMFVLRSEIDGLLTESDTDFMSGWISEDQLKADYGATPYNPSIIEMRISKAKLRQERTDKADLKAALINRYVKGDLSEAEFANELSRLGIQQNRIAIEVTKANATKLKTVKEETTVTNKALTESTYSRSYRLGLIPETEYRSKLAALKYSTEDIDLLVSLNTPEKPAPEEMLTLTLGELKAAFRVGVLTENELAAELDYRHYSPEDIKIIIETEKGKIKPPEPVKPEMVKTLSEAEMKAALRALVLSTEYIRPELVDRGYSLDAINVILFTELAKLKEDDLRKAFRTDIITEGELRYELERREYKPEDIAALIAEEKAKK